MLHLLADDVTDEMVDWIMTPAKIPGGVTGNILRKIFGVRKAMQIDMWHSIDRRCQVVQPAGQRFKACGKLRLIQGSTLT